MAAKKNDQEKEPELEELFEDIENILSKMEKPETGLNDSFELYKEGITKLQKCNEVIGRIEHDLVEI